MADLTEQHLDNLLSGYSGVTGTDDVPNMIAEIRRHRAAMKRLEAWESDLMSGEFGDRVGPAFAERLHAAVKGDANG